MISYQILQGNSYDVVRRLFPYSIGKYRVIITSPPYYGQRYYGQALDEIGHERNAETYVKELAKIFSICKDLLSDDGSLWLICGDTRRNHGKLMIPHRLALKLVETGYIFRDDIIWYKKNNVSSSSKDNFTQAYEVILFLSNNEKCFTAMNRVRSKGNEAIGGGIKHHHHTWFNMNLRIEIRKRLLKFWQLYTTQNLRHQLKNSP